MSLPLIDRGVDGDVEGRHHEQAAHVPEEDHHEGRGRHLLGRHIPALIDDHTEEDQEDPGPRDPLTQSPMILITLLEICTSIQQTVGLFDQIVVQHGFLL